MGLLNLLGDSRFFFFLYFLMRLLSLGLFVLDVLLHILDFLLVLLLGLLEGFEILLFDEDNVC